MTLGISLRLGFSFSLLYVPVLSANLIPDAVKMREGTIYVFSELSGWQVNHAVAQIYATNEELKTV